MLIQNGWIDHPFIDAHVLGFDAFAERAALWPPERAAATADVPVAAVHRLAELMGTVRPVTVSPGFGMQRYTHSGQTMRAMLALLAITGQIGRPGAGWMYANLQTQIFSPVKDPLDFYPPEQPDGVVRVGVSTARLGPDMLAQSDPPLRMAWVERGNPIPQNPETHSVLKAFRALEFRVVVEEFLTDTAREADLVLPAKTLFEQTDVIGAYWHPYIQLRQKLIEPPGEVKPETEIYRLLAHRLGFPAEAIAAEIPGPADADIERWPRAPWRPSRLNPRAAARGPVPAPGAEEAAYARPPLCHAVGADRALLRRGAHPLGLDLLPDHTEPAEAARRAAGPESTRYPLHFLTPNTKNRIHSQFNNLNGSASSATGPTSLSPADARLREVADGDRVRILNDRGRAADRGPDRPQLRAGCVVVTNGWWFPRGGRGEPHLPRPRRTWASAPPSRQPRGGGAGMTEQRAFHVDLNRCTGCGACVAACGNENEFLAAAPAAGAHLQRGPPPGAAGGPPVAGVQPLRRPGLPAALPAAAYWKDPATGVVTIDEALHWLHLLRLGVPLRRAALQHRNAPHGEVHLAPSGWARGGSRPASPAVPPAPCSRPHGSDGRPGRARVFTAAGLGPGHPLHPAPPCRAAWLHRPGPTRRWPRSTRARSAGLPPRSPCGRMAAGAFTDRRGAARSRPRRRATRWPCRRASFCRRGGGCAVLERVPLRRKARAWCSGELAHLVAERREIVLFPCSPDGLARTSCGRTGRTSAGSPPWRLRGAHRHRPRLRGHGGSAEFWSDPCAANWLFLTGVLYRDPWLYACRGAEAGTLRLPEAWRWDGLHRLAVVSALRVAVGFRLPLPDWCWAAPRVRRHGGGDCGEFIDRCEFYGSFEVITPRRQSPADIDTALAQPQALAARRRQDAININIYFKIYHRMAGRIRVHSCVPCLRIRHCISPRLVPEKARSVRNGARPTVEAGLRTANRRRDAWAACRHFRASRR